MATDGAADESAYLWYASFGSMMNSVALKLRGIHPQHSVWCEILGYRRIFYAISGVATLQAEEGAVTHAVAHRITSDELATLQMREPPVVWVKATLRPSGESPQDVCVASYIARGVALEGLAGVRAWKAGDFVKQEASGATGQLSAPVAPGETPIVLIWQSAFDTLSPVSIDGIPVGTPSLVRDTHLKPALPTARYIDLMLEGAKAVCMDASEIDFIAATPSIPRKQPHELLRFPKADDLKTYTKQDVLDSPGCIIFRDKVLRGPGTCFKFEPGTDAGLWFSRQFYDPMFGLPPNSSVEPWDGWPRIEDRAMEIHLQEFVQVGWLQSDPQHV
eukprot:TRINITY_DN88700_c0_g1_i1.p1 TRINITY_DN88700_c0_g1~~TRINITY_DN88700_c0_g1_i1.p1  ORF type:complete len:350 (-),score=40.99 TRINITY_DN88700_c0_g1_i1:67-1062(-)